MPAQIPERQASANLLLHGLEVQFFASDDNELDALAGAERFFDKVAGLLHGQHVGAREALFGVEVLGAMELERGRTGVVAVQLQPLVSQGVDEKPGPAPSSLAPGLPYPNLPGTKSATL